MTIAYFTQCGLIQIDEDKNAELTQAKLGTTRNKPRCIYEKLPQRATRERK